MAAASTSSSISNDERRWVVIGVCLTKVLTPALRNVLATEIPKWHQILCQSPTEIDKQVYGRHKIQLNPSTLDLNYKSINNNNARRSSRAFDYAIKDPLSLAKLFVQPFMSKFTGFDKTMDISTVLSVILLISERLFGQTSKTSGHIATLQIGLKQSLKLLFKVWKLYLRMWISLLMMNRNYVMIWIVGKIKVMPNVQISQAWNLIVHIVNTIHTWFVDLMNTSMLL